MLKAITAFAVLATVAATTIAPAHAIIVQGGNGLTPNGVEMNGLELNGLSYNALNLNGITNNAITMNAITMNALNLNGLHSGNGIDVNGTASDASSLTIQAIELPPETR